MKHPTFDDFWKQGSYDNWSEIAAPALNITGWWDMNFPGAPLNFENMKREGATPDARDGQKLVIGPWPHWVNNHRSRNGVDFGEHAIIELDDYITRFFDRWLKGKRNGIDDEKPVYIFVLGANEWWAEDSWPLARHRGGPVLPPLGRQGQQPQGRRRAVHGGTGATSPRTPTPTTPRTRCASSGGCTTGRSTTASRPRATMCSVTRARS